MKNRYISSKSAVFALLLVLVCSGFTITPAGGSKSLIITDGMVFYVGGDGPGNYSSIQAAIDDASDGDMVFVFNGTYEEILLIYKQIMLIGEDSECTIIDGGYAGDVVRITSSSVTMKELCVRNSGQGIWDNGIEARTNDVHILDCIVTDNSAGIYFTNVSDSSIIDCYIHNNTASPIIVYESSDNVTIKDCRIEDNGAEGRYGGISIDGIEYMCSNIEVTNCRINNNLYGGIGVSKSTNVVIHHNTITGSTWHGVHISSGDAGMVSNVQIYNNTISDNGDEENALGGGILLSDCEDCVIIENNCFSLNNPYDIHLLRSSDNTIIANNFIGNYQHAFFVGKTASRSIWMNNYWERARLLPTPIFGLITLGDFFLPWFNVDWRPALVPYDI